jgi:hypothetical protein
MRDPIRLPKIYKDFAFSNPNNFVGFRACIHFVLARTNKMGSKNKVKYFDFLEINKM